MEIMALENIFVPCFQVVLPDCFINENSKNDIERPT